MNFFYPILIIKNDILPLFISTNIHYIKYNIVFIFFIILRTRIFCKCMFRTIRSDYICSTNAKINIS